MDNGKHVRRRVNFEDPAQAYEALTNLGQSTFATLGDPELEVTLDMIAQNQAVIMLTLAQMVRASTVKVQPAVKMPVLDLGKIRGG